MTRGSVTLTDKYYRQMASGGIRYEFGNNIKTGPRRIGYMM
jgi:hypothetical protein